MKIILIFFSFFLSICIFANDKSQRWNYKLPSDFNTSKNSIDSTLKQNSNDIYQLQNIKFNILNGNLENAKILLNTTDVESQKLKAIVYRYQAIISFLEGKLQETERILGNKIMQFQNNFGKVCLLRSLNLYLLNKDSFADQIWAKCKIDNLARRKNGYKWFDTFATLKTKKSLKEIRKDLSNISIDNTSGDEQKMYLKLGLYLGLSEVFIPRFKFLGLDSLEDIQVRELLGLIYFRNKKFQLAYQLLEDLNTVNAEIIKGNIYLAQKKYELAYAQYKLALKAKSGSQNAFERLLPLSWILGQWQDGISYVNQLDFSAQRQNEADSLRAAFHSQLKNYQKSNQILLKVRRNTNFVENLENTQILSYNFLSLKKITQAQDFAEKSCFLNDGINCWLAFKIQQWPLITQYLDEKSKIVPEKTLSFYKNLINDKEPKTIKDTIYIEQSDVDLLDDQIINLR